MSVLSVTVEIAEEDGTYTALDNETGAAVSGDTKAMALVALATALCGAVSLGAEDSADPKAAVQALQAQVGRRFSEEGVTEDDVDDAIEWARSR